MPGRGPVAPGWEAPTVPGTWDWVDPAPSGISGAEPTLGDSGAQPPLGDYGAEPPLGDPHLIV